MNPIKVHKGKCQKQNVSMFKISLVHIVITRLAMDTERPCLKKLKENSVTRETEVKEFRNSRSALTL